MRYDIALKIFYDYDAPSMIGRQLVRVLPREINGRQHVIERRLALKPTALDRVESTDFFGNAVLEVGLDRVKTTFEIALQARVDVWAAAPGLDFSPSRDRLAEELAGLRGLGPTSPLHHLASSSRVVPARRFTDYAAQQVRDGMSVLDCVRAIGQALHRDMTFEAGVTEADTSPEVAFDRRRGVCQDFTHIMIACLRGIGIPAGYVSGFLRTIPPEGAERLEGADAMHAWVQAWCGIEMGWVEYDPTNAIDVGQDHVVVAMGRDYADVSPLRGVARTVGASTTGHSVDVVVAD